MDAAASTASSARVGTVEGSRKASRPAPRRIESCSRSRAAFSPMKARNALELALVRTGNFELQQTSHWLSSSAEDVAEVSDRVLRLMTRVRATIDRRIGHLAEVLAEEVVQRPVLFGEDGQRRVVPHRADGFLASSTMGGRSARDPPW